MEDAYEDYVDSELLEEMFDADLEEYDDMLAKDEV